MKPSMKNKVVKLLLLLILSLLITSCKSEISDILSSQCQAPCWRNIEPGITTQKEVLKIIKDFNDVRGEVIGYTGNIHIFNDSTKFILKNGVSIRIYYLNDVVAKINFYKSQGITTFEKCINEFGTPENIGRSFIIGPGLPIGATSAIHPWLFAVSPQKGIVFGYDAYKNFSDDLVLSSNTKVIQIIFYDVNIYSQLLEDGDLVLIEKLEEYSEEDLYQWNGYGDIEELYPRR
jgi:hypothetical protein